MPRAVIFDLPVGGWQCRPTAEFGFAAADAAGVEVAVGNVGAGVGARAGVLKGGLGTASIRLEDIGVTVGAIVAVNSAGNVADPVTGLPWLADQIAEFGLVPPPADQIAAFAARDAELSPLNTTIAVVATDAALSKAACKRMAIAAQDALARTMRPSHTPLDGDTVFALATGAVEVAPARERRDTPAGDVAGDQADDRRRRRGGGLSGPRGHGRSAGRRVDRRNTDLPTHVARSVQRPWSECVREPGRTVLTCW